jgi:hypothetical protein
VPGSNIYTLDSDIDSLAVQLGSRQYFSGCLSKNKSVTVQPVLMECPRHGDHWSLNFNIPALPARPSFAAIAQRRWHRSAAPGRYLSSSLP